MTSLPRASTGQRTGWQLFDKLYGTRYYTHGAELQKPRKVPMRVEPKSYFALERTFLSWMGMAATMGGVSSALVGFGNDDATSETGQIISSRTIDTITCIYTTVAMAMMAYALFTYEWRSKFMRRKQMGFYDDKLGPTVVAVLVLITLVIIFILALVDYFY